MTYCKVTVRSKIKFLKPDTVSFDVFLPESDVPSMDYHYVVFHLEGPPRHNKSLPGPQRTDTGRSGRTGR